MKKIVALALGLCLVGAVAVKAEDKEKAKPTAEQKKIRKEILEKYDANKDANSTKKKRAKSAPKTKKNWRKPA